MEVNLKEKISLEKEAKKLLKMTKGKVRGAAVQHHIKYIREREGEKGIKKVEEKLKELGHPLNFEKIRALEWVLLEVADLIVLCAKHLFGWGDKDIFDMGNSAPKYSFIVKLLMKYFVNIRRNFEECPKYWRLHFTPAAGTLEAHEINEKEKYLIVRLRHQCHPIMCIYYRGYFLRIAQYTLKSENPTIKETKCMSKGHPYHEFIIRWA